MATETRPPDELKERLLAFRQALVSVVGFSFFINLVMLVPAIYMLQIYDRVLMSRNETTLWVLTGIVLGVYVLMGFIEHVRAQVLIRVSARLDLDLSPRVFVASFEQHLKRDGSATGQGFNDLTQLRQFLTGPGLLAFFDAPWAPLFILVIALLHPLLGLLSLGGALILLGLAVTAEFATRKPLAEANAIASSNQAMAGNALRNVEAVAAMGMLDALLGRWRVRQAQALTAQIQASVRGASINAVTKTVRVALQSLILGVGAYLALDGTITPGAMIAASILMGRALAPVEQVIGSWRQLLGAREAYRRLADLLTRHPVRPPAMPLPPPRGRITLEGLVATAPGGQPLILKGLNLSIEPGEVVGVVGPSAAGKTTLARVLVGLWPPAGGKARLDGVDLHAWDKSELGPWLGYLPQDVELIEGTIAENIARFGTLDAVKVVEAATRAGIHDMILRLPQGYDTPIRGGAVLSAGQRQRLALARAMYGRPAVVVLDEPNSNLDDAGESALLAAIEHLRQEGCTVVLVSHRPNLMKRVDKLLLLADGAVQAYGPRDEILARITRARGGEPPAGLPQGHPAQGVESA